VLEYESEFRKNYYNYSFIDNMRTHYQFFQNQKEFYYFLPLI